MSPTPTTQSPHSPSRRGSRLVAPALCAVLVATAPSAAQAQTLADGDTAGDIVTFGSDESFVPVPGRVVNDVTATTITHGATRIGIRVEYAELRRRVPFHSLYVGMVTDEGARRHLGIDSYAGRSAAEVDLSDGRARHVECAIRHAIDYDANVVTASFPRRCASSPRWMRFRVGAMTIDNDDNFYLDDALRDRPLNDQDSNYALSGRIYRDTAQ
jgi:hypothetical protein